MSAETESKYRVEGHEGIYWVYPTGTPTPFGNRMDGAVGIVASHYDCWTACPVRRGVSVRGWAWSAPTRRQALAQLFAWLGASLGLDGNPQ